MTRGNQSIVQMCFIVADLDAAMTNWIETIGAGPFFAQKNLNVPTEYRGKSSFIDVSAAFGQAGAMQVELIEVHGDNPSVYRDMYSRGESGLHHVALFVDDLEKEIQAQRAAGHAVGMQGSFAGTPYAYIDTRSATGIFTELFQNTEAIKRVFKTVSDAALNWTGAERVLPMAALFE